MIGITRRSLRRGFDRVERGFDKVFGPEWNPFGQLGALGWFLFWIVAVTGIYLFIFFDTGVENACASVEWMTDDQWFHAGVTRSFHRYASDLMVAVMLVHMVREFAHDRYRGARWLSWVTGIPLIWFVYISGITGYWLVWDVLAQYVAVVSTELLDWLPIFGEPIARNFLTPESVSGRFFTLMAFLHIAIPLLLLLAMWIHIQRISGARVKPSRALGGMVLGGLLVVSLAMPATSQGPANLAKIPAEVGIDWFFLPLYPLIDAIPAGFIWGGLALLTIVLFAMPWLPKLNAPRPVEVSLENCNGCARCVEDCPYSAIDLVPRTDGAQALYQVLVNPDHCVACGICVGSCPSSSLFRNQQDLVTGIDLPDFPLTVLRERVIETAAKLEGRARILTIACEHAAGGQAAGRTEGTVVLPCVAMAPPSLIDFLLSRGHVEGVCIAGCAERDCQHRLGVEWTKQRIAGERDPYLRARVPRERVEMIWAGPTEVSRLLHEIEAFRGKLERLPSNKPDVLRAASDPASVLKASES